MSAGYKAIADRHGCEPPDVILAAVVRSASYDEARAVLAAIPWMRAMVYRFVRGGQA